MNYTPRKIFEKLDSLMQFIVFIYHWLLFSKNGNLKHTAIFQRKSFTYFSLFYIFFSLIVFLNYFFAKSLAQNKHHVYNPYCISYKIVYIVLEIYFGGRLLEDFYCYYSQVISAVAKESLIPYNLTQRAPGTQNL